MKILLTSLFIIKLYASNLIIDAKFSADKNWRDFSQDEKFSIENLLSHLRKSHAGAELIKKATQKANSYNLELLDIVKAGPTSLTDTTMTRRFHADEPEKVIIKTQSVVYLNRDLNQFDALMDLAHELTHFVYRQDFNPYQVNFSLTGFIKNTIESEGGEVHAFMMECNVLKDLFPTQISKNKNCIKIYDEEAKTFSKDLAIKRFYSLGNLKSKFEQLMSMAGEKASLNTSSEEISFISSAYGIPYPIAAFKEYRSVMNKVCANDQKRLAIMSQRLEGRGPASFKKLEGYVQNYQERCSLYQ